MFRRVQEEFGTLEIFVHSARPDLSAFYQPPLDINVAQWQAAHTSRAQAFLVATQEAVRLMPDGGRILAVTYSPSGRTGSWQPWVAMGPPWPRSRRCAAICGGLRSARHYGERY
jgi:enoyl-[acyl-carrier-protein] reductase (NADH)